MYHGSDWALYRQGNDARAAEIANRRGRMAPIQRALQILQRRFRTARMRAFLAEFNVNEHTRILDVGGTAVIWLATPARANVFLLNMPRARAEAFAPGFFCVEGDGCNLPFTDQSFDVVFSNSVIEHVGSEESQLRFAREVARVGKRYWIQTPNRYFPIETHLLTPLVHLLPKRWSAYVARRFTVWALIHRPAAEEKRWYLEHFLNQVRLCSRRDVRRMFPDASIRKERFLFFTKSLIAIRKARPGDP